MTKKDFLRKIIKSSVLTAIAIALIITLCVLWFLQYSGPSEENTTRSVGTVTKVYHGGKHHGIVIKMSTGEQLQLVYLNFSDELYSAIGYDLDALCELLEGKTIEYCRMDRLPWVTEIYVDGITIDNNVLTAKQIIASRIAVVIVISIMLAFPICAEVFYIKKQYRYYKKAEKKRARKARRSLKAASQNGGKAI